MIDLVSSFSADGKFRFCCEGCEKRYAVAPAALGRKGKCPKCKEEIIVPNPSCDVIYDDRARFFSVTLLKAKGLAAIDKLTDFEHSFAIVNGRSAPLTDVFPLEAIKTDDARTVAIYLVDDSLVTELKEIYPDETDLFARLDERTPLASISSIAKSAREDEFFITVTILSDLSGSPAIQLYLSLSGGNSDEDGDRLTVVNASLPNTGSELLKEYQSSVLILSEGQNQIISNMHSNLRNDIEIKFKWSNGRGIIIEDELVLPGAVVERLLLMVNAKLCSELGGIHNFDARSEIAFYRMKEKDDLPNEVRYDEEGNLKVVYILVNPSMPGIVKIGRTTQGVCKRMEQLNTTGVALPYECFYAAFVHDDVEVERALHEHFADCRVNQRREFFEVSPQKVMRELFQYDLGDATDS